jgi:N-acetylglucosaminyldiphosphoundecaprenol N-acetyl-beta-D-mannosaminyltransferase
VTLHARPDGGYNPQVLNSLEAGLEQYSKKTTPALPPVILPNIHLLGIPFHGLTCEQAIEQVKHFIVSGKGPYQICLTNAYTVSLAWKDFELRRILDYADLVLADGMSIVWGGRWIGIDLPGRIAGPDFTTALCQYAETMRYRVYFLGSSPENLMRLKHVLLRKWPQLQIVGMHSPPMCDKLGPADNQSIFDALHAAKPDILFVGMSTPKQEKWIASNLKNLEVPVSIGIGAAFDFMSGRIPRAPLFFQKTGLEWLYRLYREPRRLWKRYLLGNFVFLSHLGAACFRFRLRSLREPRPF